METLLSVAQVAARLGLSPNTVRVHLSRGVLRGIKRGRQWRVPESALTEVARAEPEREVRVFAVTGSLSEALAKIAAARDELQAATSGPLDAAHDLAILRGEALG